MADQPLPSQCCCFSCPPPKAWVSVTCWNDIYSRCFQNSNGINHHRAVKLCENLWIIKWRHWLVLKKEINEKHKWKTRHRWGELCKRSCAAALFASTQLTRHSSSFKCRWPVVTHMRPSVHISSPSLQTALTSHSCPSAKHLYRFLMTSSGKSILCSQFEVEHFRWAY